jgi:hypothetical protein
VICNYWRKRNPGVCPALSWANLSGTNLSSANLRNIDLSNQDLSNKDLSGADLKGANLSRIIFNGANLSKSDLTRAILVDANLENAVLSNCSIYGISVWDIQLEGAKQEDLVIILPNKPMITVDNLDVAQFIYLLLNNENIRHVIDTISYKVVLILGRFSFERKVVLNALREALRQHNYLPILFDFEKPASRDVTETVSTLAHPARFVIVDITDAKSIPQELMIIVPNLPSVPVQPLILNSQQEYGMFEHFSRYPWVLPIYHYTDEESLLHSLKENIIEPAEKKAMELASP